MIFKDGLRRIGRPIVPEDTVTSTNQTTEVNRDASNIEAGKEGAVGQDDWVKVPEDAMPAQDAQQGIEKIEAVTLTWKKSSLALLLIKYDLHIVYESLETS